MLRDFYNDCVFVHQIFELLLKVNKDCFVIYIIFIYSTDYFKREDQVRFQCSMCHSSIEACKEEKIEQLHFRGEKRNSY